MAEKAHDLSARLDVLARWLQQEEDELLYTPNETGGIGGLEVPMFHFVGHLFFLGDLLSSEADSWMNPGYLSRYVLDGHTPVPVSPDAPNAPSAPAAPCRVALTVIAAHLLVSPVFIGLDYERFAGRPPLVFETLVIRDGRPGECTRYSTWDAAVQGHAVACESLRASLRDPVSRLWRP
jgi:hypothetical protein